MATYLKEEYEFLATNPTFTARVRMACIHVAREIFGESSQTPGYPLRLSLAKSIISSQEASIDGPFYVALIASDPNVIAAAVPAYVDNQPDSAQSGVTDAIILQAVRDVWSVLAGVTPEGA